MKVQVGDTVYWHVDISNEANRYIVVEINEKGYFRLKHPPSGHVYDGWHSPDNYLFYSRPNPYTDEDWV